MRTALFVEGAPGAFNARTGPDIDLLWNERMAAIVHTGAFDRVVPISKKHLVAMDPDLPTMSGASEPLDQLVARELAKADFDAALVLWDLVPAWNPAGQMCRWTETLDLYRGLSRSDVLPEVWTEAAAARLADLEGRTTPSERARPPTLQDDRIIGVCMDPTFEAVLCCDEGAVRRALGLDGTTVPSWPKWHTQGTRGAEDLVARVINVAVAHYRSSKSKPPWLAAAPASYARGKDAWASFLLRELSADSSFLAEANGVQFVQRLQELPRAI